MLVLIRRVAVAASRLLSVVKFIDKIKCYAVLFDVVRLSLSFIVTPNT